MNFGPRVRGERSQREIFSDPEIKWLLAITQEERRLTRKRGCSNINDDSCRDYEYETDDTDFDNSISLLRR